MSCICFGHRVCGDVGWVLTIIAIQRGSMLGTELVYIVCIGPVCASAMSFLRIDNSRRRVIGTVSLFSPFSLKLWYL